MRTPQERRRDAAIKLAALMEKTELAMIELRRLREKCGADTSSESRALQRDISEFAAWLRKVDWMAA